MGVWGAIYFILFVYRLLSTVVAMTFVRGLTKLGDSGSYQNSFMEMNQCTSLKSWLVDSTCLTETVGVLFHIIGLGNKITINLAFSTIAFIGIVVLLNSVKPSVRRQIVPLFFLPSFTLWSSFAGKEAIVVFSVCVTLAAAIRWATSDEPLKYVHLVGMVILWLYKAHYFVPMIYLFSSIYILRNIKQKTASVVLLSFISFSMLWFFRDTIDALSMELQIHFGPTHGYSTREWQWREPYDVFRTMWEGMWLASVGPTYREALGNPLQLVAYAESMLIIAYVGFLFSLKLLKLPMFGFIVVTVTSFWLLFINYPFGFYNPGAAIRYRTGWIPIIFILVTIFLSHELEKRYLERNMKNRAQKKLPSGTAEKLQ